MLVIVGFNDSRYMDYAPYMHTYTVLDLENGQVYENVDADWCLERKVYGISKTGVIIVEPADLFLSLNLERVDLDNQKGRIEKYFSDSLICHDWENYILWQFHGHSGLGTYNLFHLVVECHPDCKMLNYITTPFQEFRFFWGSFFKRSLTKAITLKMDINDVIVKGVDSNEYCRRLKNYYDTKRSDR